MFGLKDRDLDYIYKAVKKHKEIDELIIFGSRAIGNYKKGSDIDIVVKGKNINRRILKQLNEDLSENYPLPYFFDIINYNDINNKELKNHIDEKGKTIFKR